MVHKWEWYENPAGGIHPVSSMKSIDGMVQIIGFAGTKRSWLIARIQYNDVWFAAANYAYLNACL